MQDSKILKNLIENLHLNSMNFSSIWNFSIYKIFFFLISHPDKNPEKNANEMYRQINTAYEILSDPVYRKEYDDLIRNGIPWHRKYYGKYAHRYGAPDHDIRWVLFWLITVMTIGKYVHSWYWYKIYRRRAMKTSIFKQRLRQYLHEQGIPIPEKKFKRGEKKEWEEDDNSIIDYDLEDWTLIGFQNIEKPQLKNLFVLQLLLFPYYFAQGIYRIIKNIILYRIFKMKVNEDQLMKEHFGMENATDSEWHSFKSELRRKAEHFRTSTKAKRFRRMMKKQ